MTTLLEHFIPEAGEHLANATAGLLKLERNPSDEGLINEVFRAVHTLKGSSGLFDVPGLTRLVHAGEDLLVDVRAGRLQLDSEIVDLLLDSLDRVSTWVDALARNGKLPDDAESVSVDLARLLRARITSSGAEVTAANTVVAVEGPPRLVGDFPEADRLAAFADSLAGGPPLHVINYQPDEGCFYRGEDPFNLFRQLTGLKAFLPVSTGAPLSLEETDPFRCTRISGRLWPSHAGNWNIYSAM
jgi:two-component system chemotaxis sensor kinase CheA